MLAGWSYGVLDMLAYVREFGTAKNSRRRGDRRRAARTREPIRRGSGCGNRPSSISRAIPSCARSRIAPPSIADWRNGASNRRTRGICNGSRRSATRLPTRSRHSSTRRRSTRTTRLNFGCCARNALCLIVCREEWREVVTDWTNANAVPAQCEFFGKHMMFWDAGRAVQCRLERFLADIRRERAHCAKRHSATISRSDVILRWSASLLADRLSRSVPASRVGVPPTNLAGLPRAVRLFCRRA